MNHDLLRYYNDELGYIRGLAGEFAKAYPKIAGRLGLTSSDLLDPYVERLIEAFAFLTARLHLKLDHEFPRFTQQLLELLYPGYLAPTPSMLVVSLEPKQTEGRLAAGYTVPRHSPLRTPAPQGSRTPQTPCEYVTAHEVTLWPIELTAASYSSHIEGLERHSQNQLPLGARSVLRLCLRSMSGAPLSQLGSDEERLNRLTLFLDPGQGTAARLYETLLGGKVTLLAREGGQMSAFRRIEGGGVRARGFERDDALLPDPPRMYQGYRLLHEYFAFPERYLFVDLLLGDALTRTDHTEVELLLVTTRSQDGLEGIVDRNHFRLFCTPAVNLFPRHADRIHLTDTEHEYAVIADRSRPMDLEIHSVTKVTGFEARGQAVQEFLPMYRRTLLNEGTGQCYYTVRRRNRLSGSNRHRRSPHSTYLGDDVFVTLVDGNEGPYRPSLKQLGVEVLCTNHDLPLHLALGIGATDFVLPSGAPVAAARVVAGPTAPKPSLARGAVNWRLLRHLRLGYLSLNQQEDGDAAGGLRTLLSLYAEVASPAVARQVSGVLSMQTRGIMRPLPLPGPPTFGRGSEITIGCDEREFEGGSAFLLGAVLECFLAAHASINSFTETVLKTVQHGEVMRWPTRIGCRPAL